eukprot:9479124-Pyramimonas_sp.AAC.2
MVLRSCAGFALTRGSQSMMMLTAAFRSRSLGHAMPKRHIRLASTATFGGSAKFPPRRVAQSDSVK